MNVWGSARGDELHSKVRMMEDGRTGKEWLPWIGKVYATTLRGRVVLSQGCAQCLHWRRHVWGGLLGEGCKHLTRPQAPIKI